MSQIKTKLMIATERPQKKADGSIIKTEKFGRTIAKPVSVKKQK